MEVKSEEMLRSLWQMKVLPLLTCLHIHAHVYFTPFQPEQLQFVIFLLYLMESRLLSAEEVQGGLRRYCEQQGWEVEGIMAMIVLVLEVMQRDDEHFQQRLFWCADDANVQASNGDFLAEDDGRDKMSVDDDDDEDFGDEDEDDVEGGNNNMEQLNMSLRMEESAFQTSQTTTIAMNKAEFLSALTSILNISTMPTIDSLLSQLLNKSTTFNNVNNATYYWLRTLDSSEKRRKYRLHPLTSSFIHTDKKEEEVAKNDCISITKEICLVVDSSKSDDHVGMIRAFPLSRSSKREAGKAQAHGLNKWPVTSDEIHELQLLRRLQDHKAFLHPSAVVTISNNDRKDKARENDKKEDKNDADASHKRKREEHSRSQDYDDSHEKSTNSSSILFTRGLLSSTTIGHISFRHLFLKPSPSTTTKACGTTSTSSTTTTRSDDRLVG